MRFLEKMVAGSTLGDQKMCQNKKKQALVQRARRSLKMCKRMDGTAVKYREKKCKPRQMQVPAKGVEEEEKQLIQAVSWTA